MHKHRKGYTSCRSHGVWAQLTAVCELELLSLFRDSRAESALASVEEGKSCELGSSGSGL